MTLLSNMVMYIFRVAVLSMTYVADICMMLALVDASCFSSSVAAASIWLGARYCGPARMVDLVVPCSTCHAVPWSVCATNWGSMVAGCMEVSVQVCFP